MIAKEHKDIDECLVSMGYRKLSDNVWGKPVGFHLFTYEVPKNKWSNWFKGDNDTTYLWNSETYGEEGKYSFLYEDFAGWLKVVEAVTRTDIKQMSNFEFNIEQIFNL